jgi:hypothetical protein
MFCHQEIGGHLPGLRAGVRIAGQSLCGQPQGRLRPFFPPLVKQGFQGLAHQLGARLAAESRFLTELLFQVVWKSEADGTHGKPQT